MKYITVATAYIHHNNKALLLRRSVRNKHFKGTWQLPEGKLEKEELSADALSRELEEELHSIPESMRFLGHIKTNIILEGEEIEVERSIFHVTLQDTPMQLSSEHDALIWIDISSVKDLSLYPGTIEVLQMNIGRE